MIKDIFLCEFVPLLRSGVGKATGSPWINPCATHMMPFQGCRVMIIISYDHCVRPKIRILDRFFLKKSKIISK
ncbi:MAG: hypothetical protein KA886_10545, partial [Candidatus Cloacimonetes bacterium]|nr:hypothetical protein [Candidatus Cloacimonadota bacterium]